MFTLSSTHKFHLYSLPTDMRKGFNDLSGILENLLEANSKNGDVYIFINKGRDKIKLLHWQGAGFTLYYKRLEFGTFELPDYGDLAGSISLTYAQMVMILDGLSIKNIQTKKRYKP